MPRKYFRKYLPSRESIRGNRFLARLGPFLQHPNLWALNRHSVSGGVAVGLFAGLVPGPLQMLTAALIATPLRVNLPVAVLLTLYTNPFTIFPLYWLAYQIGAFALGTSGELTVAPPDVSWVHLGAWLMDMMEWIAALGKPLLLGLFLLAIGLAGIGYVLVQLGWQSWVRVSWQRRKIKRRKKAA